MNIIKQILRRQKKNQVDMRIVLRSAYSSMLDSYRLYIFESIERNHVEDTCNILYNYLLELQEVKNVVRPFGQHFMKSLHTHVTNGIINLTTDDEDTIFGEMNYKLPKEMPSDFFYQDRKTKDELKAAFREFFTVEDLTFFTIRRYLFSLKPKATK